MIQSLNKACAFGEFGEAALPGKQNKEPVQDCVLLRCCLAWQARKGARAFANCVALDGAIPPADVRGL